MYLGFKRYLKIVLIIFCFLMIISCEGTIDYGQELVTTADGLPTWQDSENGPQQSPTPAQVEGNLPVFLTIPSLSEIVVQGEIYSYSIEVTDIDVGDKLTVVAEQIPGWLELQTIATNEFKLVGTPTESNIGAHNVVLKVIDSSGLEASQSFNIVVQAKSQAVPEPLPVTPENRKPVAYSSQIQAQEDKAVAISLKADDADGNSLSYIMVSQPKQGKLSGSLPNVQYLANQNFVGTDSFIFRVSDGKLSSDNAIVSISVVQVNDPPVAQNSVATTDKNKAVRISMSASDIETQSLSYSIVSNPKNGNLSNASANAITYTPNTNFVGTDSFTFRAHDNSLNSNVATVSITVKNVAEPQAGTYRVLVDTDIGHDPDDIQSLYRLAHYSDILKVEGLLASASINTSANVTLLEQWIRTIRINEMRAKGYPELMTQEALLASVKLGSTSLSGPAPGRASPGSNHIIASVENAISRGDSRPLYILVWGPLTSVAQALHDNPDIAPHIRIYSIGSSNVNADVASRNYVYNFMQNRYRNLWWIENGSPLTNFRNTYFGIFFQGYQVGEWANGSFIGANIRGHGAAGDAFPTAFSGLQEGDSPSMLYLLSPIIGGVGNVNIPTGESWGGQFTRHSAGTPNFYIDCCSVPIEAQRTINKWRVQFLEDWKSRWDRYN